MAKNKLIDMTGYDDIPDWYPILPNCPRCYEIMGYSQANSEFKCPACGHVEKEDDVSYEPIREEIPVGCAACGGPYPQCKISCKMFDD